jgi:hypothetical protein
VGRKKWDKDSVKIAFKEYIETGKPLQAKKFRQDNGALYGAILYHFKSYKGFIEEIGLNYDSIADKKRWTNEKVIEEFKKFESEGYDINPKTVYKHRVDLYAQISERFGSYKEFVEMLGYDYKGICKHREWTKDEIKDVITSRVNEGESLYSVDIINEHFALYRACETHFGSYKLALEYAGIDYSENVGNMSTSAKYGHKFERLLAEMFDALGKNYVRYSRDIDGIIPDFFDADSNRFIDAKLSSWTVFYSDTIEKYLPHCSELVIVYLRGPQIQRKIDGVELRHISYYFDELKKNGLEDYIGKFSDMLFELERIEKEAA